MRETGCPPFFPRTKFTNNRKEKWGKTDTGHPGAVSKWINLNTLVLYCLSCVTIRVEML